MSSFTVTGCNHTSFTVREINTVLPFFIQCLGFELVSIGPRDAKLMERVTGERGVVVTEAFLRGPGITLKLIQYYAPVDRTLSNPRLCDAGAAHIGIDVDDIDAAAEMSAGYGFHLANEIVAIDAGPNAGRRIGSVRNGDGLTVELLGQRARKPIT
jgi:hypothetical protein